MNYYYQVYGLRVESEIECKELLPLQDNRYDEMDVKIEVGCVSEKIHRAIDAGRIANYTNQEMWFHIKGVATYCMTNGNLVTIEAGCDEKNQLKLYLTGSCLGMIMLQRSMIAIHGGAVMINNRAVVFTGDRGAGKTTLTSALRMKGYPFVADDVSAVKMGDDVKIHPGFPQQKLCEDVMIKMGYDLNQYKTIVGDSKIKYLVPTLDQFVDQDVSLQAVCELRAVDDLESLQFETLKGTEKFMTLYKNIYRIEMKQRAGIDPEYFKHCIELAKAIPVYRMSRPKNKYCVDEQIALVEKLFDAQVEKLEA